MNLKGYVALSAKQHRDRLTVVMGVLDGRRVKLVDAGAVDPCGKARVETLTLDTERVPITPVPRG